MSGSVRVLFLARFRDRFGRAEQQVDLAPSLATVRDLIHWLHASEPAAREELIPGRAWRVAVNHTVVPSDAFDRPLAAGDEVAFLPPVTGG